MTDLQRAVLAREAIAVALAGEARRILERHKTESSV